MQSATTSMSSIGTAGVRAVKWSVVSTIARFALQLLAQVILARLLGPENYGIFGIGMVVYTFSNFLSNFGFGWSLMQRAQLSEADVRFAFTWQVLMGCLAALALFVFAAQIAQYFHEPRVQPVIEWLSLACVFSAATAPANSLLQRDLNFRTVGIIQVASYAVGYLCVGIPMALAGHGAFSLVAAWLTQTGFAMVGSVMAARHPLKPLFWYGEAGAAFSVGGTVFVTNVGNWLLNNLDRVLIGRLLNAHAVGLYVAGYNLATMPNNLLLGALQPAFLAAGARLQDEPARLGAAYFQMLASICVLVAPAFVFLSLISDQIVALLYGPKWSETAWVLAILFLSIPAFVAWGLSTPVLWNTGRKSYEFLLQLPLLVIGAIGLYMLAPYGIKAAAAMAAALLAMRALVVGYAACKAVQLDVRRLLPHALRGLGLSMVCVLGAWVGRLLVEPWNLPLLSMSASAAIVAALLTLLVIARPGVLGEQATAMVIKFVPRLAGTLRPASGRQDTGA